MDTVWAVRDAYNKACKIKASQDEYCIKALAGDWESIKNEKFPESYQWESLVEILRGRVKSKVQTHCYEALDIDNFVRISNEFQFPVAAFHHAHEAYLVPEVLKRAYNNTPAIAMFSTFSRYKREAFRHSEFAPRILAEEGVPVIMKSDHSAIVSRNLIHEAAVAHYYGLSKNLALASVITTPAKVLGLDHRIGYIAKGYDADVVLWDSHPLSLGATPIQVFIDGIPQLTKPNLARKPLEHQNAPLTPDFSREAAEAVRYEGLPPITPRRQRNVVVFTNISSYWARASDGRSIIDVFEEDSFIRSIPEADRVAVATGGHVVCQGNMATCAVHLTHVNTTIDLEGGAIQPGLVSYGSSLGLAEIAMEPSTGDGTVIDPLEPDQPALFGRNGYVARAIDGLQFGTRNALLAYRSGVTLSITAPMHSEWLSGLSVAFSPGAPHRLAHGAIVREVVAVHCTLGHGDPGPSVSSKISALRRLLTGHNEGEVGEWFQSVVNGTIPLIIDVGSADIIASLVALKKEVESLPGPPLSADSLIGYLLKHNVTVGLGPHGIAAPSHPGSVEMASWAARNLRFDAGEAMLDAGPGVLSKADAFALASSNVETLLGLETDPAEQDLVATVGGDLLDFEGKVVAVISPRQGVVDIFVTLAELFNFSSPLWLARIEALTSLGLDQELALYELLDLDASGESVANESDSRDEAGDLSELDALTAEILHA
ncbi:hypothetical protein BN946_scf184979.g2 [Trametes cinnabarina]|uniref:Amidohydrolase-related domain-containing protein n=1 Tax=Pycnoporus cinnabarinus TaxID=5643 RepID=A0A060SIW2_PYCCI|nr:hypothetical protein BN946_scf184979.g2 [Trametes cinnabarina]